MSNLLIVESPGKIKKLRKILGSNWQIKASMGHFRSLANDGEDNLGFDLNENQVQMRWQAKDAKSKKVIKELKEASNRQKVSKVYVATDPDREGEVIAWHIFQTIKHPEIVRVTFSEITEAAVRNAIANPRQLNQDLVGAGLARSCLDKLVGFRGSPLVWSLNLGAKSIGRVQSAVLHLVCEREREIQNFTPENYFSVFAEYAESFKAFYLRLHQDKTNQQEQKEDSKTPESKRIYQEAEAARLVAIAKANQHQIISIQTKRATKNPPPPFITSTLQQAVGSKLGFSPDKTMKLAQTLYEKGLITYMRTDSIALSDEFCQAAKKWLEEKDPHNVPKKATKFRKGKNAQEAHEAIRPSDLTYPSVKLKQEISEEEFNLYLLIWKRAIASQCAKAQIDKTVVLIQSGEVIWEAKGQVVNFKGYARYWNDLKVDSLLPELREGQILQLNKADFERKQTSPPSRYGEPQLVALMEKKGIGRPSTYSSSVKTIKSRKYVRVEKKKLIPTELGMSVDSFLMKVLVDLIQSEFTAKMESSLDEISVGSKSWQPYLCEWNRSYFAPALDQAVSILPQGDRPASRGKVNSTDFKCPVCGKPLEEYHYVKEGQEKSLLRCSDSKARKKKDHKKVVFFKTRQGNWWSKDFGQL